MAINTRIAVRSCWNIKYLFTPSTCYGKQLVDGLDADERDDESADAVNEQVVAQ